MSAINNIKVFKTPPHPCSYLDDRKATTLFIDPNIQVTELVYSELNEMGFRRSGKHFYTPHCNQCKECIPTRIPIDSYTPGRRHQRIVNKNSDLSVTQVATIDSDEHYQLYARYIELRHREGDMYPPSEAQYLQFIGDATAFSHFVEYRHQGRLLAVSVTDELPGCLSAIYTFFEPDEQHRSLGNYAILSLIESAKQQARDYLYLGYWIRECRKMAYKIDFRPIELFINGRWQLLR